MFVFIVEISEIHISIDEKLNREISGFFKISHYAPREVGVLNLIEYASMYDQICDHTYISQYIFEIM